VLIYKAKAKRKTATEWLSRGFHWKNGKLSMCSTTQSEFTSLTRCKKQNTKKLNQFPQNCKQMQQMWTRTTDVFHRCCAVSRDRQTAFPQCI